jgi:hypothetical protein
MAITGTILLFQSQIIQISSFHLIFKEQVTQARGPTASHLDGSHQCRNPHAFQVSGFGGKWNVARLG